MKTLNEDLGFFFSCYKENDAVKFCIQNIREYYPENPIYLSSDGGSDFTQLTSNDLNIKFEMYEDILGYVNNPEHKNLEILIDCCQEFLDRMKNAVTYCNKEYIMYYEPDILLRGKVRINEDLNINGSYANTIDDFVIRKIESYYPQNKNKNFGSCGGSIINCKSFEHVYEKTNRETLRDLIYTDPRISNCDYLLTVLFSINGFRYDKNEDFIEARREHWQNTNHSIVHQYHHNYSQIYDGKYKI